MGSTTPKVHETFANLQPDMAYDPHLVLKELKEQITREQTRIEHRLGEAQVAFEKATLRRTDTTDYDPLLRLEELVNAHAVIEKFLSHQSAPVYLNPGLDLAQQILARLDEIGGLFKSQSSPTVASDLAKEHKARLGLA